MHFHFHGECRRHSITSSFCVLGILQAVHAAQICWQYDENNAVVCRSVCALQLLSTGCCRRQIFEWVKAHGGEPIIPFSGIFENKLFDMPADEKEAYCKEVHEHCVKCIFIQSESV